jgi:ABC-2 type transport system permease protein
MNWRTIRAIARKDLLEVRQNRMAWMPMAVMPIIFCILLPLTILVLPTALNVPVESVGDQDLRALIQLLPPSVAEQMAGMSEHQTVVYFILGLAFAPFFLILPIMTAGIIGSDSFVGEKERKTMEALLYTPATDRELFLGKMLAAVIPAVLISWLSFLLYIIVLNGFGANVMGRIWFPTPQWWPLMLWVTPAVAVMGMLGAVIVSARVRTFMEAYQTTGLLVLPVVLLIVGQLGGVVYLSVGVTLVIGLVVWMVDAFLLWFSLSIFNRSALLKSS